MDDIDGACWFVTVLVVNGRGGLLGSVDPLSSLDVLLEVPVFDEPFEMRLE